jgi:uncharacterized protein (TIGR03083 family)
MTQLGYHRVEAEFEVETARLGAAVSAIDPEMPLPTCPQWTVRDLVTHVGTGHRWATAIVQDHGSTPPPYVIVNAPHGSGRWAQWLTGGARRLAEAVRASGPDRPVWTWRTETTAEFWLRKMLHDEIVHRFDVELAANRLGDVSADLAADGVSDLLASIAMLSPPDSPDPIFSDLIGTGQTLQLEATNPGLAAGGEWFVERTPSGVNWRHGQIPADTTVRGPARELLLVLNRRLSPSRAGVEIAGDAGLFTYWLEHSRF